MNTQQRQRVLRVLGVGARLTLGHSAEFPKGLFGDWGGRRSELDDHGVDFELEYINDVCG